MQISELSRRSGVSIASIKFYVREGLLPTGVPTGPKRSEYDDHHVRRLRLIRALIDIGELSVANAHDVLGVIDSDATSLHDAFGSVMHRLDRATRNDLDTTEVEAWISGRGWTVDADAPAIRSLADLIATLRQFDLPISAADFDRAADHFESTAEADVAAARSARDRIAAVETMVIGTVVIGRALSDVRRLALEAVSARMSDDEPSTEARPADAR